VAEVILNRVRRDDFPDSVCGVVKQGTGELFQCQFSYYCDGLREDIHEPVPFERAGKIARLTLDRGGFGLTGGATHFHNSTVRPSWSRSFEYIVTIGKHRFYRDSGKPPRVAANVAVTEDGQ